MKILYGVQGTGNGHTTRARAMAQEFAKTDADVTFLFSGRPPEEYFDMEPFGDYLCYPGLTFVTEKGKIKHIKTALSARIGRFIKDVRSLDLDQYDLIVTDFEPITAWAGRVNKRDVIGIGHQYAFDHKVPVEGDHLISRLIMKFFAPASVSVGLHWHHFGQPILPPIISPHAHSSVELINNQIQVYLPFEDPAEVVPLLQNFSDYNFQYFTNGYEAGAHQNVTVNPLSRDGFQQTLLKSAGVICNAGFELTSEALDLGKRILLKPVAGQMEQLSNAKAIEILGLGRTMLELDRYKIADWLEDSNVGHTPFPNVAAHLVAWLEGGAGGDQLEALTKTLWAPNSTGSSSNSNYTHGHAQNGDTQLSEPNG